MYARGIDMVSGSMISSSSSANDAIIRLNSKASIGTADQLPGKLAGKKGKAWEMADGYGTEDVCV